MLVILHGTESFNSATFEINPALLGSLALTAYENSYETETFVVPTFEITLPLLAHVALQNTQLRK